MKTLLFLLAFGLSLLAYPFASVRLAEKKLSIKAKSVDTFVDELDGGTGGISVDKNGTIYVSDFGQNLNGQGRVGKYVFRITPEGDVSVLRDDFKGASGSGIDSKGNFFQSNIAGEYVTKITPDGTVSIFSAEHLTSPVGIEIDRNDNLYVADCGDGSIQKITPAGVSTLFLKSDLLKCPNGISLDDSGNFYVANFSNGNVVKITPEAKASVLATIPGGNNGHVLHHEGILYVVARSAHQIYTVTLDGKVELLAGSGEKGHKNGSPLEASFLFPNDIGISPDGKTLYVNEVAGTTSTGILLSPMVVRRIHLE